jgi:anti-sigma B factor antagonist
VSGGTPARAIGPPITAAQSLSITRARPGSGSVRVRVVGEIDMATAPRLRDYLLGVIAAAAAGTEIRVDLADVTFIDASGVGVLVGAERAANRAGVGFCAERPQGVVLRIFQVLNLSDVLLAVPGRPAAPRR